MAHPFVLVHCVESTPYLRTVASHRTVAGFSIAAPGEVWVNLDMVLCMARDNAVGVTRILLGGLDEGHFIAMSVIETPFDIITPP